MTEDHRSGSDSHHHQMDHEDGEPWLVSYADMMTLLFGFFVLMYTFAEARRDDKNDDWIKVKREVAAYFGGAEPPDPKQKGAQGNESQNAQQGFSDMPAVPFESKFRFLATRDEVVDEVKFLLENLSEKSSNNPRTFRDIVTLAELDVLRGVLSRVSGAAVMDSSLSGEIDAAAGKAPIYLAFDSRSLVAAVLSVGEQISPEGMVTIKNLARQLAAMNRPLRITTESRQSWTQSRPPNTAEETKALELTSRRAVAITQALHAEMQKIAVELAARKGKLATNSHIFAAAGVGYFEGKPFEAKGIANPITFSISLIGPDK